MMPDAAGHQDGGADVVALVREAMAARDDVVEFDIRDVTPVSAVVEIEAEEEDGTSRRTLYRVRREPDIDDGEHLH
jgi:hypothetical protein